MLISTTMLENLVDTDIENKNVFVSNSGALTVEAQAHPPTLAKFEIFSIVIKKN